MDIRDKRYKIKFALSKFFTPPRMLIFGFLFIILIGTAMLAFPFSAKDGRTVGFMTAFFTSVSATCVTGLSVVDLAATYSAFGHVVILLLVQIGGLGFMTISSSIYLMLGKKISLKNKIHLIEETAEYDMTDLRSLVAKILIMTLGAEAVGFILFSIAFSRYFSAGLSVWYGLFHAVMAFCNAGFDIFPDSDSLVPFYSDPFIMLVTAILIILGGIGFIAINDVWKNKSLRKCRVQTKVVFGVTAIIIFGSSLLYWLFEHNNPLTIGEMNAADGVLNAFFHAVSSRTAGFSAFDAGELTQSSVALNIVLMFIGASPGSLGGGIKTTTVFILVAVIVSTARQKKQIVVDKHKIGKASISKAASVIMLALAVMVVSLLLLTVSDGDNLSNQELLFEQVSAYSMCGLSLGATSALSVWGQLIIILNMYLGRVGVLTFFLAFSDREKKADATAIKYPEANISV